MKITIVSPAYPLRGGIANFTGLLYRQLTKENEVTVVTFSRQYPSFLFPGKTQFEPNEIHNKIPAEIILDSINPLNWKKVGKKIRNDAPDLLIFAYWLSFFAPSFTEISKTVKRNGKTKVMTICHNVIPHEPKPFDRMLTKMFFKHVDSFITLSDSVAEDLQRIIPNAKQKLLFHPVYSIFGNSVNKETARKRLGTSTSKVVLFFGFIRDYKGLDTLLEALSLLDENDITAIIAGEYYSDKEKYIKLIEKFGLQNKVKLFNDFIPAEEVKYFFSAADVVLLPYKNATQSGIIQIANNFRKPVIATNVGGLGEMVLEGKTGYVVPPDNPKEFAQALKKFYENYDEDYYSNNVEVEARKYSWETFSGELLSFAKEGSER